MYQSAEARFEGASSTRVIGSSLFTKGLLERDPISRPACSDNSSGVSADFILHAGDYLYGVASNSTSTAAYAVYTT